MAAEVTPLPARRLVLRSTMTVRAAPSRPFAVTIWVLLRGDAEARSSARTFSTGSSMSAAAISACCCGSSVRPRAAVIASFKVGGSKRTRRVPYFVFQTVVIIEIPDPMAQDDLGWTQPKIIGCQFY